MNIHIKDKYVFDELKKASFVSIPIGSKMYGTDNDMSDTDILYIYNPSISERNSVINNHHQYQYKENDIDHIFTDIFSFIKNSLNGDSSINFETLHSKKLIDTDLEFLYDMRYDFHNYKILRCYLGMARRDLKHVKSSSNKNKKLNHAIRGYYFVKMILDKSFNPIIKGTELFDKLNNNLSIDSRLRHSVILEYSEKISTIRENINFDLCNNNLDLPHYMDIKKIKKLDNMINNLLENNLNNSDYYSYISDIVYDSIENGITYEDKKYII